MKLERRYKLDAPKGVNGRNSDNETIRRALGWEPSTGCGTAWSAPTAGSTTSMRRSVVKASWPAS